jgi:hypothetical protein
MLKLNVTTALKPQEVVQKAVQFFGPHGFGLKVESQNETCAYLEGGGGGVEISTCADGGNTSVDIFTREWENQVKDFGEKIKIKAKKALKTK